MLQVDRTRCFHAADIFCADFRGADTALRGVFGRNEYAASIAAAVDVGFFVDDFTSDSEFAGRPVLRTEEIPEGALVVSAVVLGRPRSAAARLTSRGCRHLDYFQFWERSGLDLAPVTFWAEFESDFDRNKARYEAVYQRLADAESRKTFRDLLSFRLTADLGWMAGYTDRQREQYFEPFLELRTEGETFVDVGSFDGFTSLQFMEQCPDYASVMVFEPEAANLAVVQERLAGRRDVRFFPYGLAAEPGTVRFSASGSSSSISDAGDCEVQVETLDRLADQPVSFIKMDIEGAEGGALAGAMETIRRDHPRLAVCVYHQASDIWRLPEQVLAIRDDYRIFLRHYTEGVTETVMFFVP